LGQSILARSSGEELAISAGTAFRLDRCFGTSGEFWRGLQTSYDLEVARQEFGERLDEVVPHATRLRSLRSRP
jgi:plasmid maintenance system antidote protein VapI